MWMNQIYSRAAIIRCCCRFSSCSVPHNNKRWEIIPITEKLSRSSPMRPMSVKKLLQINGHEESALIKTAEWVRSELAVRLANRLLDFHRLPYIVICNPFIEQSYNVHVATFETLMKIPPIKTSEEKTAFINTLREKRQAHDETVDLMERGSSQLRYVCSDISLHEFLERFFFFRIGRRTMIDHLIGLEDEKDGWSGCINLQCRPASIIQSVVSSVRETCRASYGIAPLVKLGGNLNTEFSFIPDHLALIVEEVLKNAMRATIEFNTMPNSVMEEAATRLVVEDRDLPEVIIEVYKGRQDVSIKISDKGGGFPLSRLNEVLSFGYSSVRESREKLCSQNVCTLIRPDMAGYGFGLPLSRVFARYFGGDIQLQPCFGVGTDAFISLNHIGDQNEPLFMPRSMQN